MAYILKLFDKPLLKFNIIANLADPVLEILWIDEANRNLLPLDMGPGAEGLASWIRHRTIPKNRAYVNSFLSKCGLNANRPMDVIAVCRGLSLNDAYWVTDESDDRSFDECNLYENRFSQILAWTAFTGYGSSIRSSFRSSPEFTTNGMLPKCWRRERGKISLYKGGTIGFSNAGNEPYAELYAAEIGRQMGIRVVPYHLARWKGKLCSVCELFTGKEVSYVPAGRLVRSGGMEAVRQFYASLGPEFTEALNEMIVFDAVICNTDRHFGNFGVLVDSRTNRILAPAPLFDHGNSLFNYAGDENWANEEVLARYVDTLLPVAYEDFIEEGRRALNDEIRDKLRGILTIRIEKVGKYNYPDAKLRLMEQQVRKRVRMLLE